MTSEKVMSLSRDDFGAGPSRGGLERDKRSEVRP